MVFAVLIVRLPIMPAFAVFVPPIAFLIAVPSNHLIPVYANLLLHLHRLILLGIQLWVNALFLSAYFLRPFFEIGFYTFSLLYSKKATYSAFFFASSMELNLFPLYSHSGFFSPYIIPYPSSYLLLIIVKLRSPIYAV